MFVLFAHCPVFCRGGSYRSVMSCRVWGCVGLLGIYNEVCPQLNILSLVSGILEVRASTWQGKDYKGTVVSDQLRLKERERVQHLGHRGPQIEPLDQLIRETWSAFSEAFVSDSKVLSMLHTHSESCNRPFLSLCCLLTVFTERQTGNESHYFL